jgi:hypothetical protein
MSRNLFGWRSASAGVYGCANGGYVLIGNAHKWTHHVKAGQLPYRESGKPDVFATKPAQYRPIDVWPRDGKAPVVFSLRAGLALIEVNGMAGHLC